MKTYENELYAQGKKYIAGTDEVGRGPLAGPVVTAAVIFPASYENPLINDSKKLSKKQREELFEVIKREAIAFSIIYIDVKTIDEINVKAASRLGMKKAVEDLKVKPDHVLIDYEKLDIDIDQTSIVKGDEKSLSIAAASILAKVERDRHMEALDLDFPIYGWKDNAGYGSQKHRDAIVQHGWTKHHRKSFNPVKSLIAKETA